MGDSRIRDRLPAISLVGVVMMAIMPALALGARRASRSEARAITTAVKHSSLTRLVPSYEYNVVGIRISPAARGWAKAGIVGKGKYAHGLDAVHSAGVVLRLKAGRWRVRAIGGEGLGCRVPRAVVRDLRVSCP